MGLSGSRRRNGNTRILTKHSIAAAYEFIDEFNAQVINNGLNLRIKQSDVIYESHFDDHDDIIRDYGISDTVLFSSPVYFGSISPSINLLLQELSAARIDQTHKVASSITVGTQRNGGQETAIEDFFRWYIANNITFVGNGPVTSQYGGTAWGGGRGSVEKDIYGISTSRGAGKRAIQESLVRSIGTAAILAHTNGSLQSQISYANDDPKPLRNCQLFRLTNSNVALRFLMFTDATNLREHMRGVIHGIETANKELSDGIDGEDFSVDTTIDHLPLSSMIDVKDCAACTICPPGNEKKENEYGCIYNDDVNKEFPKFNNSSAIMCDCQDQNGLVAPAYWMVLNRMRSVRRNNFMLTGKLGVTIQSSGLSNNHVAMKWLIRNNMGILSTSNTDYVKFGKLLFRETLLRTVGRNILKSLQLNPWTAPNHHE